MQDSLFALSTPFTPPTTEEDELAVLRLIRSRRVGPTTYARLIAEYGTAQAALDALPEVARAAGVAGYATCPEAVAIAELRAGRRAGARLLCLGQAAYPAALAQLADAPPVLWLRGDAGLLGRPMVALVGARNASSLGLRMARKLAEGIAEAGITVVSGLARGIDAAAHGAALRGGTIAVLAGGIDIVYPPENADLAQAIAQRGLALTEQPPGLEPQARHFPMRNRIISGLVRAVVVVEAAARSGSLITARLALDQGREVMAVPGHPLDARAAGCNMLIRDGATLVRGGDDILAALATPTDATAAAESPARSPEPKADHAPAGQPPAAKGMSETAPPRPAAAARTRADHVALHRQILDRLGPSPIAEDQLIRDLCLPAATIAPGLLALEIDGRIRREPGGLLARIV
jgi:DNA processing protein